MNLESILSTCAIVLVFTFCSLKLLSFAQKGIIFNRKVKRATAANMVKKCDKIPRIILWTTFRSMSTVFERSILQLPNGKVFHEPFSTAYCFGPQKQIYTDPTKIKPDQQWKHKKYHNTTFQDIENLLTDPSYEKTHDFMFAKDAGCYLTKIKHIDLISKPSKSINNNIPEDKEDSPMYYEYLLSNTLKYPKFIHTFLIRNPLDSLVSLYKLHAKWGNEFDTWLLGLDDTLLVYKKCVELGFDNLIIIDADDLVSNPKYYLCKYCNAVGLKYSDDMLTWDKNDQRAIDHFKLWHEWHDSMFSSNGFMIDKISQTQEEKMRRKKANEAFRAKFEANLSQKDKEQIETVLQSSIKSYKFLYSRRVT